MLIKSFFDLIVYQEALALAKEIEELIRAIPYYRGMKECDQILRSSKSVHSNIAEGFSQRFYKRKFVYYLKISLGSSDETQDHLSALRLGGHISEEKGNYYHKCYRRLSIKILNFITYISKRNGII